MLFCLTSQSLPSLLTVVHPTHNPSSTSSDIRVSLSWTVLVASAMKCCISLPMTLELS